MQAGSTTRSPERARVSSHDGSDASLKRRQVGTGTKNSGALAEWTNWQTRSIQPCLRMSCAVLAIRAVIGAAIREHGIALGDSRFGVDFNPSRNPRIADIKRRAADPIDAIETIAGENRPSEIARFKALTVTDIEAVAMWTAKAAAQSGHSVIQRVTCRLVPPAPRVDVPHVTRADLLDLLTAPRRTRQSSSRRRPLAPPGRPAVRLDEEAPPATAATPPSGFPSCPHKRLETSPPHPASPGRTKPPNAAAPEHTRICAFRPPRGPLHRTPRRLATRPKPPSTRPKVPLTRPSSHAQTRQRAARSPCTQRAACAAASSLRLHHLVARLSHNRGVWISD